MAGQKKAKANGQAKPYSESFEAWWQAYPRREKKRRAGTAWQSAVKRIASERRCDCSEAAAWLQERTRQFATSDKGRGQYCPHPATWLNDASYDDEPSTWLDRGKIQSTNGHPVRRAPKLTE